MSFNATRTHALQMPCRSRNKAELLHSELFSPLSSFFLSILYPRSDGKKEHPFGSPRRSVKGNINERQNPEYRSQNSEEKKTERTDAIKSVAFPLIHTRLQPGD